MRLGENGLLRRQERAAALMSLLQMMARTPQGSWQACPRFGLRDLFENSQLRADTPRLMAQRVNEALEDLGIAGYSVTEVVRELSPGRETDVYALTVEGAGPQDGFSTSLVQEW